MLTSQSSVHFVKSSDKELHGKCATLISNSHRLLRGGGLCSSRCWSIHMRVADELLQQVDNRQHAAFNSPPGTHKMLRMAQLGMLASINQASPPQHRTLSGVRAR